MKKLFLLALLCAGSTAFAADPVRTVNTDPQGEPESISQAPDGTLYLGSASKPVIFRAAKGESQAKIFVDVSSEGKSIFLGVLVDAHSNTLWGCQIISVPNSKNRRSALRAFDLKTGAAKFRWDLPGEVNLCNDFVVGPDQALYVSDTLANRIWRLKPGAAEPEMLIEDRTLDGIDGITFLDGVLYVNNVISNNLYRIPLDASGKAGKPEQIWPDRPIKGPDGMRAAHGKLFLAENANGRVDMVTVEGDQAKIVTLLDGLSKPTAVDPAGDLLWIGDRGTDKAVAIPLPK